LRLLDPSDVEVLEALDVVGVVVLHAAENDKRTVRPFDLRLGCPERPGDAIGLDLIQK